jgi:hypothetical protein
MFKISSNGLKKSKSNRKNKSKELTDKEFDEMIKPQLKIPKTNYRGLFGTKEGMDILRKMSWVEIEDLTDLEFYGE